MLKIVIYIILSVISILTIINSIRTNNAIKLKNQGDASELRTKYSSKQFKQYIKKTGKWEILFQPFIQLFILLVMVGLVFFVVLIVKKYYLLFMVMAITEFYNVWSLWVNYNFIQKYLEADSENTLNLANLDSKSYKKGFYASLRSGIILVVITLLLCQ